MNNKQKNGSEDTGKHMTKYDRKMEAKKAMEEKERRDRLKFIGCLAIIGIIISSFMLYSSISTIAQRKGVMNNPYISVGDHNISEFEYVFYYNSTANNYLNYYSSVGLLEYTGIDTTKSFAEQQYNETMTWKDYFDELTVEQIQNIKSLLDDANAKGFTYDTTEDYNEFKANFKSSANSASQSLSKYYKSVYGMYATADNIKPLVTDGFIASAYMNNLIETNKPSDEDITAFYEANKDNYDKVDYRSFTFAIEVADEASEDDIKVAMDNLKAKAEAMKADREAGTDFETLCLQYATEDEKPDYEDPENEGSLSEGDTKNSISSTYNTSFGDWLYESTRTAGELTIIENEAENSYYVVEFLQRTYDETTPETIANEKSNEKVNEYVTELAKGYEVKDISGNLVYLLLQEATEEATEDVTEEETEEVTEE